MPKPRSTWECHSYRIRWCGTSHCLSIQVTRRTFPNVSLNVPFVLLTSVLLIVLYALRMLLAIIGAKNQIWSDSAAVWQAVVTLFIRNRPIMMETIESVWYYLSRSLAPLLWINLLALSLSYWRDKDKDMDARSRREKHAESQHCRRYDTKRGQMRQGSIRDYNLCSSYPLHLHQRGLYRGRPPNISQRMNAEVTQNVVTAGLLLEYQKSYTYPYSPSSYLS
jgi:hypothetical protein